jgi:hypothetical protein
MATPLQWRRNSCAVATTVSLTISSLFAPAAMADDFDAVTRALNDAVHAPPNSAPQFTFPATVNPDGKLLAQLQTLFARFFTKQVDLIPLIQKIVVESVVAEIPSVGKILYNPSHSLFLYLPDGGQEDSKIQISTVAEVTVALRDDISSPSFLNAYTQGFRQFEQLAKLMRDQDARETLQVVWIDSPRSQDDNKRIQLLLLGPIQRALGINSQSNRCKRVINNFVDDVRAGRDTAVPPLPGLTNVMRPSNFFQGGDKILLVLSETLIARYYVLAEFTVDSGTCRVVWQQPMFVM